MYYKKSHKAWYANLLGRPHRLGVTEDEAKLTCKRLQQTNCTVADLVAKFLAHHEAISTVATLRYYTKPLKALADRLGQLTELRPHHVTQWVEEGAPSHLTQAAKACFRWAEEQEYIKQSPLRHLRLPPAGRRGDWAYLTPQQWQELERRLPSDLVDLVVAMHETGCRPQEVRHIEARHFDRANQCWIFPREESKGKREPRIIHLSDAVYEICQRLALKHPEGPLFRNSKGRPWSTAALVGRFDRLSKRLGFRVTPYCVRHTFATEAIIRGVDLQTVATILGHADLKMLSKVYQHIQKRSDHIKEGLRRAIA